MILGLSSCDNKETTNSVYIQGGGTLDDWANLSKYKESNKILMSEIDENRVVFMGNSITEGWSNFDPDFFIRNPYVNRGISGQTTPQMLIRFKPDVVNLKPKSVVILAGINDIAGNTGPMKIENIAEKVIKLNSILEQYCLNNKIQYVDYHSEMDDGNGGLKVPEHTTEDDLVHPNKEGYKVMEDVISIFLDTNN